MLPIYQLLAIRPIRYAFASLRWTYFLLFAVGIWLLIYFRPQMQKAQITWMFLSYPLLFTIAVGQTYGVLFVLATGAWLLMERGYMGRAAVCIGLLIAMKPILLLWPVFLFVSGRYRVAWISALVAMVASAAPVVLYGPVAFRQWTTALQGDKHYLLPLDVSVPAVFNRFGHPQLGSMIAVLVLAGLLWTAYRRTLNAPACSAIAVVCCLSVAPLAWIHYLIVLYPAFVRRPWKWPAYAIAALLCFPMMFLNDMPTWLATLGFWGSTILFVQYVVRDAVVYGRCDDGEDLLAPDVSVVESYCGI
jgi:hypothetical protein